LAPSALKARRKVIKIVERLPGRLAEPTLENEGERNIFWNGVHKRALTYAATGVGGTSYFCRPRSIERRRANSFELNWRRARRLTAIPPPIPK
jgi:hypothetical protein